MCSTFPGFEQAILARRTMVTALSLLSCVGKTYLHSHLYFVAPKYATPTEPFTRRGLPSCTLQRDNWFSIRADLDRLLDGTRSLLEELGLEVGEDVASPMDEEEAEASPSPLQRQDGDPLGEAPSVMLQQHTQVPAPLPQGQTLPRKLAPVLAACHRVGSVAGSHVVLSAAAGVQPPAFIGVGGAPGDAAGEDGAEDAMDVLG